MHRKLKSVRKIGNTIWDFVGQINWVAMTLFVIGLIATMSSFIVNLGALQLVLVLVAWVLLLFSAVVVLRTIIRIVALRGLVANLIVMGGSGANAGVRLEQVDPQLGDHHLVLGGLRAVYEGMSDRVYFQPSENPQDEAPPTMQHRRNTFFIRVAVANARTKAQRAGPDLASGVNKVLNAVLQVRKFGYRTVITFCSSGMSGPKIMGLVADATRKIDSLGIAIMTGQMNQQRNPGSEWLTLGPGIIKGNSVVLLTAYGHQMADYNVDRLPEIFAAFAVHGSSVYADLTRFASTESGVYAVSEVLTLTIGSAQASVDDITRLRIPWRQGEELRLDEPRFKSIGVFVGDGDTLEALNKVVTTELYTSRVNLIAKAVPGINGVVGFFLRELDESLLVSTPWAGFPVDLLLETYRSEPGEPDLEPVPAGAAGSPFRTLTV